jgi:hypothetical protein
VFVDASTALSQVGDDQPALLARVLLEPVADGPGVPHDNDEHHVLPVDDLNVSVQDATVTLTDANSGEPELGDMPVPEVWPVMFDPDDDGRVTLGDLSYLAVAYQKDVGDPAGLVTYRVDFDHSLFVDLGDLSWLAGNFDVWKHDEIGPLYPTDFPDIWRPQNLELSRVRSADQQPGGDVDADSGAQSAPYEFGAQSAPYELTSAQLAPIVKAAVSRLESVQPDAAAQLGDVDFEIVDLPANVLGTAYGNTVQIDINAAGQGWFVDATAWDDAEFVGRAPRAEWAVEDRAALQVRGAHPTGDIAALQRVDLLTVVLHELGHVLGYEHGDGGYMDATLSPGTRWLPMEDAVDRAFASFD